MENLYIYDKTRSVPENAQKPIKAGRLKGMTDINPMWRIKILTEVFGVCGIGWKTQIVRTWLDEGANGEVTANVEILLFVKLDGEWSEGIPGIGGSKLISKENSGLYTDDECYKKAYTDAISVACKALGIGADIYWNENTKYTGQQNEQPQPPKEPMTYEKALAYIYKDGKYPDKTLAEIYKTDIANINELGTSKDTPQEVITALCIINEEIKKAKANKQ